MTRDQVIALLDARDPIAAAGGLEPPTEVGWLRGAPDGQGVECVRYGAGTTHAQVADRLLQVAQQPGDVRAVLLVPGHDTPERPGSWGNEDLLVAAVARRVLPHTPIRLDWSQVGEAACQVAVAFGADEWVIPADADADPDHLAAAVGARAVAR
jgi:hypothetical protein